MEEPEEWGPVPTSAGSLLAKDALAPRRVQHGHLSSGVLIVCGNAGVTEQHCIKVSLITLILQYRFATPKSLKIRPWLKGCKTVRLCKPSTASPFPLSLDDFRSVLAVKGPLRPGPLRADPKGMAVYEGKGGYRSAVIMLCHLIFLYSFGPGLPG